MENFFKLVLGESDILPGKTFTEYDVFFVLQEKAGNQTKVKN